MKKSILETKRSDRYFLIPAVIIYFSALVVTMWDFIVIQGTIFHFGFISLLGLIFGVIGFTIRIRAKKTLGNYYSYGLKPPEKLVKSGIYRYIRHPIYLALIIYNPMIPMLFYSLYGFLLMQSIVPLILYRIKIEEDMLLEEFGDEYLKYMKNTKKLIPFIY